MQWRPNPTILHQLSDLLTISVHSENSVLKNSYDQLEQYKQNPEFLKYIAFIFAYGNSYDIKDSTRLCCGYYLKSVLRSLYILQSQEDKALIRQAIMNGLIDSNVSVRHAAGTLVSSVLTLITLDTWPELLNGLFEMIQSTDIIYLESGMNCLSRITEDCALQLDSDRVGRPLNVMVPLFLQFFCHENGDIRLLAVKCMRNIIDISPQALTIHLNLYLQNLSHLSQDVDPTIRALVCNSLTSLIDNYISQLSDSMDSICLFMLTAIQDQDSFVAIQATEFWTVILDVDANILQSIFTYLDRLIPIIINNMRYNSDELCDIQNSDTFLLKDNIVPYVYKNSEASDSILNDINGEWTLRKASGGCLEQIACVFNASILQYALPCIQTTLNSSEWYIVESGILSLGAIAEGCQPYMENELNDIFPLLLNTLLTPSNSSIFGTVSWCIGRYAIYVYSKGEEMYIPSIISCLLKAMKFNNNKIQHSATSCLCVYVENDDNIWLSRYFNDIMSTFIECTNYYNEKNIRILLELLGILAERMPDLLSSNRYPDSFMPFLMNRWKQLADLDEGMLSILECLIYVIAALGDQMLPFFTDIYKRCVKIIDTINMQYADDSCNDKSDKMYISCCMDLIGALIETGKGGMFSILNESNLLSALVIGIVDSNSDVRQSSLALLGDISQYVYTYIESSSADIVALCLKNINLEYRSVTNNAIWAIGEIIIQDKEHIKLYYESITQKLTPLIQEIEALPDNIRDNLCVTIGRLCLVLPQEMVPIIHNHYSDICEAITSLQDGKEKDEASRGICIIIQYNISFAQNCSDSILSLIASWSEYMNPELNQLFIQIIQGIQQIKGRQWSSYVNIYMRQDVKQILLQRYPSLFM